MLTFSNTVHTASFEVSFSRLIHRQLVASETIQHGILELHEILKRIAVGMFFTTCIPVLGILVAPGRVVQDPFGWHHVILEFQVR